MTASPPRSDSPNWTCRQRDRLAAVWTGVGPTAIVAGCVVLLFAVVLTLLPCHYGVNDDIAVLLDIQDGFDVTFFGLALGRVLSFLYAHVARSVPWYTVALLLAHAGGLIVFLGAFARRRRHSYGWMALLRFYLAVYVRFLTNLSYSPSAMMAQPLFGTGARVAPRPQTSGKGCKVRSILPLRAFAA